MAIKFFWLSLNIAIKQKIMRKRDFVMQKTQLHKQTWLNGLRDVGYHNPTHSTTDNDAGPSFGGGVPAWWHTQIHALTVWYLLMIYEIENWTRFRYQRYLLFLGSLFRMSTRRCSTRVNKIFVVSGCSWEVFFRMMSTRRCSTKYPFWVGGCLFSWISASASLRQKLEDGRLWPSSLFDPSENFLLTASMKGTRNVLYRVWPVDKRWDNMTSLA